MYFNDLRFGLYSFHPGSMDFVFKYEIYEDQKGEIELREVQKSQRDGKELLVSLWKRIKGN